MLAGRARALRLDRGERHCSRTRIRSGWRSTAGRPGPTGPRGDHPQFRAVRLALPSKVVVVACFADRTCAAAFPVVDTYRGARDLAAVLDLDTIACSDPYRLSRRFPDRRRIEHRLAMSGLAVIAAQGPSHELGALTVDGGGVVVAVPELIRARTACPARARR